MPDQRTIILLILSRRKIKNAFKCTLKELTIKCIFKGLVGLRTPSSSVQHSHDTRHVEISLCRVFCATRFLNTIFQLQKLVSKMYRAKLSTAAASYVVEGKIILVAVIINAEELVLVLNRIRNNSKN